MICWILSGAAHSRQCCIRVSYGAGYSSRAHCFAGSDENSLTKLRLTCRCPISKRYRDMITMYWCESFVADVMLRSLAVSSFQNVYCCCMLLSHRLLCTFLPVRGKSPVAEESHWHTVSGPRCPVSVHGAPCTEHRGHYFLQATTFVWPHQHTNGLASTLASEFCCTRLWDSFSAEAVARCPPNVAMGAPQGLFSYRKRKTIICNLLALPHLPAAKGARSWTQMTL